MIFSNSGNAAKLPAAGIVNAACMAVIVLAASGCGPAKESQPAAGSAAALKSVQQSQNGEITPDRISSDIVGRKVRISDTDGMNANEWTFDASEFRRVAIIERKTTPRGESLIVFVTTQNNPEPNEDLVRVAGKLQLNYVKKGGQWVLSNIENLNFQYSIGVAT